MVQAWSKDGALGDLQNGNFGFQTCESIFPDTSTVDIVNLSEALMFRLSNRREVKTAPEFDCMHYIFSTRP